MANRPCRTGQRPRILQWNCNHLGPRHAELAEQLLREHFDVLALQETNVCGSTLRLPGYVCHASATSCSLRSCTSHPCQDASHPPGKSQAAVYVRAVLNSAPVNLDSIVDGPMECAAVTVRMGSTDTTVASVYVRPTRPWDATAVGRLRAHLGPDVVVCGDFNAHNSAWGSPRTTRRGRELLDATTACGLLVANTGSPTFTRPGPLGTVQLSHIDVTLVSQRCAYTWETATSTWGSDHYPILVTPRGDRRRADTRVYAVTNWTAYRKEMAERLEDPEPDFLAAVVQSANKATLRGEVPLYTALPDLELLRLRARRNQLQRRAIRSRRPEDWTAYRRVDAQCRRRAKQRRRQSWESLCSSMDSRRDPAKAWRVFRALLQPSVTNRHPLLASAISLRITEEALAERLADQFTPALPAAEVQVHVFPVAPQDPQVVAICSGDITLWELRAALDRCPKRRSAPGIDGVTYQMLRNLDITQLQPLLQLFNQVWREGSLPPTWRVALVRPMLKVGRPPTEPASYRPVSLTSAAGKLMENTILARLQWIADRRGVFKEQQSGFRRHRCTADSLGDVVSMLEQARHDKEVAFLLLLDMKSAFDSVPHTAILDALDSMGVSGHLRRYVRAFLTNRTLRVRVGRATSSPRDVSSGVPQGSVLSPFLFNLVLAPLPDCIPAGLAFPVGMAVYADDIAIWAHGPTRLLSKVKACLQGVLWAVAAFLTSRGLQLSETKTQAMIFHSRGYRARKTTPPLTLNGQTLPWCTSAKYLGLLVDCQLSWLPAVKALRKRTTRVHQGVRRMLAHGQGCTHTVALKVFHGMASSAVLYALPLVQLKPRRWEELEVDQRRAIRLCLGLPSTSPVAATYTEAGFWPIQMRALQVGLHHIHRLQGTPDGVALLERYRSRPNSRMGMLLSTYESHIALPQRPRLEPPPPGTGQALRIVTTLPGVRSKRSTPPQAVHQEVAALLQGDAAGHLQVYTDGSVQQSMGRAGAACTALELGTSQVCSLPFPASSTHAELAGLHLAADLLLKQGTQARGAIILTDSRSALLRLRAADQPASSSGYVERSLAAKLHAVEAQGCPLRLHWLPSHVNITGNEVADALAKGAARQAGVPASRDVVSFDAARTILARVVEAMHPDARVVSGQAPRVLPGRISRDARSLLLRLRLNCCNVGARLHHQGRRASPTCADCPEPETLEHLLCSCPQHDTARTQLRAELQRLGAPSHKLEDFLFPTGPDAIRREVFQHLVNFLVTTGLALRL